MIIERFEQQVKKCKDKVALRMGSEALTYGELNGRAGRAAFEINASFLCGDNDKQPVTALLFEHGIDMIIGMIAALKAGMIYVPLDRTHPESRLVYMLEDSESGLILTDSPNLLLAEKLKRKANRKQKIKVMDLCASSHDQPVKNSHRSVFKQEPAYILYTSGSTGRPKGVVQNHENVLYYTRNWTERFGITSADRMTLLTAFVHDGAVQDIWGALHNGAVLYPYDVKNILQGTPLPEFITKEKITIWHSVPTLYRYLIENLKSDKKRDLQFPYLRFILLGGEPLRKRDIDMFKLYFPDAALANVYGQTESSVSSIAVYTKNDSFGVPVLGEPLDETEILLVNEEDEIVEDIGIGEIIIVCNHLTPGYWRDVEKTREKFAYDPEIGRLYRTGDLGGMRAGGGIEILGRKDFQIKIRGFRVEVGEIETVLLRHEAVKEAVVVLRKGETETAEPAEPFLCCYFTAHEIREPVDTKELREYLLSRLPDYMLPRTFVPVEEFPLTASGKIDRNALPEPHIEHIESKRTFTPPADEKETILAAIWAEELNIPLGRIGRESHFFELGGHSLRAINLIAKIHQQFHVKLDLENIFAFPLLKNLSSHIQSKEVEKFSPITPVEKREYYPLSSAQKRMVILQQLEPGSTAYNLSDVEEWPGELDIERMQDTVKKLINRHDSFRTSFLTVNDKPVQKIHKKIEIEKVFWEAIIKNFTRPFDLTRAPLLRMGIITLAPDRHLLLLDMHHIITDGVSMNLFVKEFQQLYQGENLPKLKIQYKDYAQWQAGDERREAFKRQEAYWLKQFEHDVPVLDLPGDFERPPVRNYEGASLRFRVSGEETQRLRNLGKQEDATLYMVLLAVMGVFVFKLTGQEDVVIGTPVAGRTHSDLESMVGMLVNTLALRNYPAGDKTFAGFLKEVRQRTLEAFGNQDYPFEDLVEKVSPHRDLSRNPLFDVMFVLHNQAELQGSGSTLKSIEGTGAYTFENRASLFDLTVYAIEVGDLLVFSWQHSTRLFKKETIHRFFSYFKNILNRAAEDPCRSIAGIEIITEEEKKRILNDFNKTQVEYPQGKTIHGLFTEQAVRTPDNIALLGVRELHEKENGFLTYRELNKKSHRLAALLIQKGIQPDTIVGIMMERSLEMIIGILGILKSGGAYMPIDPDYPEERIDYMLNESGTKILVSAGDLVEKIKIVNCQLSIINCQWETGDDVGNRLACSAKDLNSEHLAYVIYTSGTSGQPKGCLISHKNVISLLKNKIQPFDFNAGDIWTMFHRYNFDFSVWEMYGALLFGGKLIIIPGMVTRDPYTYLGILKREQVTVLNQTPSAFYQLSAAEMAAGGRGLNLRYVIFGGEALAPAKLNEWKEHYPQTKLINMYGITETTVHVTYKEIGNREIDGDICNIGRPLPTLSVYVVDRALNLLPVGIAGELCVAGAGISRGYLNNPELTAKKFFYMPYMSYRSGDLGRWLESGDIEYLGRIDHQVKIRGFRIELGEIENRLLKHEEVKEAVVVVRHPAEKPEDRYLCAYVAVQRPGSAAYLREFLSGTLPDYMVPSYFIRLESIPLTSNGKVDRKALPEPGIKAGEDYIAPADEIESQLVGLWSGVLGIEESEISTAANFFELGGHSLRAAVMVSRLHKELNVKVSLLEVFKRPTVKELARYIESAVQEEDGYTEIQPVRPRDYYELSPAQKRMYILQQLDMQSTVYNISRVIPLGTEISLEKLEQAFLKLIQRHESLRTSFHLVADEPVQRIHENIVFDIESCRGEPLCSPVNMAEIIAAFLRPFDLGRAPLMRVGLVNLGKPGYLLLVDMHHIITDGISNGILEKDFHAFYRGESLLPLRIQYKDYAHWQNRRMRTGAMKRKEVFWLQEFGGEIPALNLATDYPRPVLQSFAGSRVLFNLGQQRTRALKTLAASAGATLYMVLLAVFNIMLSKTGGQEEIIIGTPAAGRSHADLEQIIGMFVNTLAMRNYPAAGKKFNRFLEELKEKTLEAFENRDYPFDDLVDRLALRRDAGRNPLFDVMFVLQNQAEYDREVAADDLDLTGHPRDTVRDVAKFDLTLEAVETLETLHFSLQYCTKLFKKETVLRFAGYFKRIAAQVCEAPDLPIGHVEIISHKEKQKIVEAFNNTREAYPQDKTISQLFAGQVERTPDRLAAVFENEALTYKELDKQAARLAHYLYRKNGGKTGIPVGILMDRSLYLAVCVLGILKAGSIYVPLDPQLPQKRIKYMIDDACIQIVISEEITCRDDFKAGSSPLNPDIHPGDPAYIIYTSGTTGRPKGVMIPHRGICNLEILFKSGFKVSLADKVIQFANISFDASISEIFMALLNGAALYLVTKEIIDDYEAFYDYLVRNNITVVTLPPPYAGHMEIRRLSSLRLMITAGSPANIDFVKKCAGLFEYINAYGPTEVSICSSYWRLKKGDGLDTVPIGKPVSNTEIYVLNERMQVQPVGVAGELCITGEGLAGGYLNNPELTKEKFRLRRPGGSFEKPPPGPPQNFLLFLKKGTGKISGTGMISGKISWHKIYKTGDLARWLPDGNVEFLGRIDQQVKIRGFRIELKEIESRLLKHDLVKEAVVVDREEQGEEKYLCAYIVSGGVSLKDIRFYLSGTLPGYMIPSYFVNMDHIPLTSSGKIDRKALPAPGFAAAEYAAPRDGIEKKLLEIWSEILDMDNVSIDRNGNFFELGGHSLKATIMISKIHKELQVKVPMAEVFKNQTVKTLAGYIKRAAQDKYAAVEAVEKKEYYALSPAQKRMYILQQMAPASIAYNMPLTIPLDMAVDKEKLEQTFKKLIQRHESLRTSFPMINEEPVQAVHPPDNVSFEIEYYHLPGPGIKPFDLSRAPLLRVALVITEKQTHILMVDMHHIISDGISTEVLEKEFAGLYRDRDLPRLRLQYKDFAQWLNYDFRVELLKQQEEYWSDRFSGELPVLTLPWDFPRPVEQGFDGCVQRFSLGRQETSDLKTLAADADATFYMGLLALFNLLLARLGSQDDIIIGTPAAGRNHADLEQIIGMFVNTLAMRNCPTADKTFKTFLKEVRDNTLAAFENQDYPFEELVEKVSAARDSARNPVFDVMFSFRDIEGSSYQWRPHGSDTLKGASFESNTSKFDITLRAAENDGKTSFALEYRSKLFKNQTIERFIRYFKQITASVLENPSAKLSEIEMLSEEEKRILLYTFNDTTAAYPTGKTLHRLFEEQSEKTPDLVALVGPKLQNTDSQTIYMTYRELNKQAGRLAYWLNRRGVEPDTVVGIMMKRSVEMIIGILGILKAGGAYLPIDPGYPQERIDYMLNESGTKILVGLDKKTKIVNCQWESGDDVGNRLACSAAGSPGISFHHSEHLAYIIYTSGTTGKPKGVMVNHENAVNVVGWFGKRYRLNCDSRVLQLTDYTFDASVNQIFGALHNGAALHVVDMKLSGTIDSLRQYIERHLITLVNFVPGFLKELFADTHRLKSVRTVISGGEALDRDLKDKILEKGYELHNQYGLTETTIDALAEKCSGEKVTLGKPIANTRCYILDNAGNLCPPGVIGELVIAGTGIARGYLNNPELTAERFLTAKTREGTRRVNISYKSGDLARWLPDGRIEFMGRSDHQVKIRGFRVELGEIENHLLAIPTIKEAVIITREDISGEGETYLCAYYSSHDKENLPVSRLRHELAQKLPVYMVPDYFIPMDRLPRSLTGKVHRKSLPVPQIQSGRTYINPRTPQEAQLVKIYEKILNRQKVGIGDDFFQLGGNSLKALRLVTEIYKTFRVEIPIARLFKESVLKDLAELVMKLQFIKNTGRDEEEEEIFVKLNPIDAQGSRKLFCFPPAIGYGIVYMQLSPFLRQYTLYAFNYLDRDNPMKTYVDTIIDICNTQNPSREPIKLLGYSAGGRLCLKAAELLEEQGYIVSDIIMLDCYSQKKELDSEEAEALSKQFLSGLKTGMEEMGLAFMTEKVLDRMEKYADYHDALVDIKPVNAGIHLIQAVDKQGNKEFKGWEAFTRSQYRVHNGFGIHREMLSPGFVEKNAALTHKILAGASLEEQTGKMPFDDEILAAHKTLSAADLKFLEFVHEDAERLKRSNYPALVSHDEFFRLNPWPALVSPSMQKDIETAALTACKLIKSVPKRIFANDPHKMSRYYETPANMIRAQLNGVTGEFLDTLMARGDFILTASGFKCLEYNISGNIGGMQLPLWESLYLQNPVISQFLKENRLKIKNKNLLSIFLEYIVKRAVDNLPGVKGAGAPDIAVVSSDYRGIADADALPGLNEFYVKTMRRLYGRGGWSGRVICCDFNRLRVGEDGFVYYGDKRIGILIELYGGVVPPEILRAFKSRRIDLYNGPVTGLLSNKLNLALLSEHEDSPFFSSEEKKAVKKYIPWTRKIVPGETLYNGERILLTDFIRINREKLVIKPAVGLGGERIYIGKHTSPGEWETRLNNAVAERKWLVQEYAPSIPLVFQEGEAGAGPHQAVWGLFVFGPLYGGGMLRILPQNRKRGVINVQQGADISAIFEVDR